MMLPNNTLPLHWVRLSKFCDLTGDTRTAVNNRVRAGKWLRDVHVRAPDGSKELWVNLVAVNDWCDGKKPAHRHGDGR